jgi:transposase
MEEKELLEAYRKEGDEKVKRGVLMMLQLMRGKSTTKVAEEFLCSQPLVMHWKKRFESNGIDGLRGKLKPGRKPKVSLKVQERIKRSILRQGYVTKTSVVRDMIAKESGVRYSVRQVQRIMHRWGFSLVRPGKRHYLAEERERRRFKKPSRAPAGPQGAQGLDSGLHRRVDLHV